MQARTTEYYGAEKIAGQVFSPGFSVFRSMHEDSAEEEKVKRQQRMDILKDMTKKIRPKGRLDADSRWLVTELLAADCEKAWLNLVEEETIK